VDEDSPWKQFAKPANIKGILGRSINPAAFWVRVEPFDLKRRQPQILGRGGHGLLEGDSPSLVSMLKYEIVDSIAEAVEELWPLHTKRAELGTFAAMCPALVCGLNIQGKRAQPI
jgi:hypothetical protein